MNFQNNNYFTFSILYSCHFLLFVLGLESQGYASGSFLDAFCCKSNSAVIHATEKAYVLNQANTKTKIISRPTFETLTVGELFTLSLKDKTTMAALISNDVELSSIKRLEVSYSIFNEFFLDIEPRNSANLLCFKAITELVINDFHEVDEICMATLKKLTALSHITFKRVIMREGAHATGFRTQGFREILDLPQIKNLTITTDDIDLLSQPHELHTRASNLGKTFTCSKTQYDTTSLYSTTAQASSILILDPSQNENT